MGFTAKNTQRTCSYKCAFRRSGYKISEQHKLAIAKANLGNKYNKGRKMHPNTKKALLEANINRVYVGRKWSEETRKKMIPLLKGRKWKEESKLKLRGENHYRYFKDRTKLAKKQNRNDSAYFEWRKQVWLRDDFKCKIANPDCIGRIEAHHILGWAEHPELRYEVNNGITLCHAHHPRKRAEEKRLSPYFMELVSVSKK